MSAGKILPFLVAAGGVLFGLLFIFIGWKLWHSSIRLARSGQTASATVLKKLRKEEGAAWGGLENYFVDLSYPTSDGRRRQVQMRLASKIWRTLAESGSFKISYLPGEPDKVFPHAVVAHQFRCGIAVVMMIFGAAAVGVFPIAALSEILRR
ncbi:MAG: DUF3592 domain-containing protein [Verrucomicrobiota bacterium]